MRRFLTIFTMMNTFLRFLVRANRYQFTSKLYFNQNYCKSKCIPDGFVKFNLPLCWKSTKSSKSKSAKIDLDHLSSNLIADLQLGQANDKFQQTLLNFEDRLERHMTFNLSPQLFSEIKLPNTDMKLGQVANLILQNHSNNTVNFGDQLLLFDMAGRPDLLVSVRKAVISFLDVSNDGSGASRIQNSGRNAFTVRLSTLVTDEARQKLIHQGHDLLNRTVRELDKIYQSYDKLINKNKEIKAKFSEDNLFLAREYLRQNVKQQHALATSIWNRRREELENS